MRLKYCPIPCRDYEWNGLCKHLYPDARTLEGMKLEVNTGDFADETVEGYCCACEYDIAGFENQIAEARKETVSRALEIVQKFQEACRGSHVNEMRIEGLLDEIKGLMK